MIKLALMFLMASASFSSLADWAEVDSNEQFTSYANASTISTRKDGATVKMLDLIDWSSPQTEIKGKPYLSLIGVREFDCAGQSRNILLEGYSDAMGGGTMVTRFTVTGRWDPIKPGSRKDLLSKIACSKFVSPDLLTWIESSPPGARIVINSDFIGTAPVSVDLFKYRTEWGRHIIVKAMPAGEGCVNAELILPNNILPKRMFFDTKLCAQSPTLDLNVNY